MGIDVDQWRAKIGLWHAFTVGRPLVRRLCSKPLRGRSVKRHECKRAFKARQTLRRATLKGTRARHQFLPFVVMLTVLIVVDSRNNSLNNLSGRLTSTRFYPQIRLAATLFLVGSRSIDKRRNTGIKHTSLISRYSAVTILAMLLIIAGDIETNPGPFIKLEASTNLAFLSSLPLAADWKNLGTRLHVPECQLATIQAIHAHSPNHSQDCLNSMFAFWLNNCAQPTCESLIQAVDALGRRDVVIKLCEKYYGVVPLPGTLQSVGHQESVPLHKSLDPHQPLPQGMHGFHQGAQFLQHTHPQQPQASNIWSGSQTGGQFGGHVAHSVQRQLGYSQQQDGVQHLFSQPQYHANPQQQQSFLPPSGQFTGEGHGISKPTKPQLLKELYCTVASEWLPIGTLLEISDGELNTIAERENGNPHKCLMAMLSVWLHRINPPASWPDIADAVEFTGRPDIAQQIRQKYCLQGAQFMHHQQPAPSMQPTSHIGGFAQPSGHLDFQVGAQYPHLQQPHFGYEQALIPSQLRQQGTLPQNADEEDQRVHADKHSSNTSHTTREKPPFGCGCGKCTFFSFLERGCSKPIHTASSFPYLDLSGLTHEQQQELRGRLCFESQEIMMKFQRLVSATILSFERHQIPLHKLRSHIMTLGAFSPVHEGPQRPALDNHFKDLQTANTVSEVFWVLRDNLSFFNYHILEHIITVLGTEEDSENLKRYQKEFEQYAKRRMYECLPQFGPTCETGYTDVFVKVDSHYEMYTVTQVEILRSQLSKILHVSSQGVLRLCRVEKGCFQLTFQVPSFVQQAIFPLSSQQESQLAEKGVIRLVCDKYQFIQKECENLHHRSSQEEITASTNQELIKTADSTGKTECVYEEATEDCTLEPEIAQQKETPPFKADMEAEEGTEPTDDPEKDNWKETSGGYDCKFVEQPPNAFQTECPVCRLLLRDPYQATCCGTSFCYLCSQRIKAGKNCCPTCRKDNFEVFPNKGLKRSISQLPVFCTHRNDGGCTWMGELGELQNHLNKVTHTTAQSLTDVTDGSEVDSTPLVAQSTLDATDDSEVNSTPLAAQSLADVADGSEVDSTPLVLQMSVLRETQQSSPIPQGGSELETDISKSQNTVGSQVSIPIDPEEKNRTIRRQYANFLREKYQSGVPSFLTLQWPPPPTLKVFNLTMISQRVLRYAPDDELVRLLQRGNVSDAVRNRNQVTLEEISGNLHSGSRKVILIEGAPGAGKSTLAWHLCRKWEAGELFQEFEIVLFVQLREPAIQSAKSLEDLFPAESPSKKKEVISAIQYCGGHQVLIVLDSWDEFSSQLKIDTVIKNLICNPSVLNLQHSAIIITSRPVATAQLQRFTTTRVEIAGFLRSEIKRYFTEAIGDPQMVQKLSDHLRKRPVIEASCYLPLNTAIVTHLFLALNHTLPTTLHGVFTSLVTNCIKRHLERQAGEREDLPEHTLNVISFGRRHLRRQVEESEGVPEFGIPLGIRKQFNNLCALAYHGVMENKVTFTAADLHSFKLPTELSTLSLIQGVASFAAHGECKLYNFFHLSTQELLAAFYISKMKPAKQVKIFNELFEQPRFSNVFQFYAAFTKLQNQGIRDTVSSIVKRNDQTLFLSLLQCLYEAQDNTLCQFVGSELNRELDLSQQTLSPVDCLCLGYFVSSGCPVPTGQFKLTLMISTLDEYGVSLLVRELAKYCIPSVTQAAAAMETENLYLKLVGKQCSSLSEEGAIVISKLGQYVKALNLSWNGIGPDGATHLSIAMENLVNLEELNLERKKRNEIGPRGGVALGNGLYHCTKLKYLNLERNQIGPRGGVAFGNGLYHCTKLEHLNLNYNDIQADSAEYLSRSLQRMLHLRELWLYGNKICDAGCISLASALRACKGLQVLDLGGNSVSDGCMTALNDLIKTSKSLKKLYLYGNKISDAGCVSLASALGVCKELQVLNLGDNSLTDGCVAALNNLIKISKSLKELCLYHNSLMDGCVGALTNMIKTAKFLEQLQTITHCGDSLALVEEYLFSCGIVYWLKLQPASS